MKIKATVGTSLVLLVLASGIHTTTAAAARSTSHRPRPVPAVTTPVPADTAPNPDATTPIPGASTVPLYGTRWLVDSVEENGVVVQVDTTPAEDRTPANLVFEEGAFHGSDGCNLIRGDVVVNDGRLEFNSMLSTMMLCSWDGLVDRQIVAVLVANPSYQIIDDRLHLTADSGATLVLRPDLTVS